MVRATLVASAVLAALVSGLVSGGEKGDAPARGGWVKYEKNPVLSGFLSECFDIAVLREGEQYRMWFSFDPKRSVAVMESKDGLVWGEATIVFGPNRGLDREEGISQPVVIKQGGKYRMWYPGHGKAAWGEKRSIGYATSDDGKKWDRASKPPVFSAEQAWEWPGILSFDVIFDEEQRLYRMWYAEGHAYEQNPIGYATSKDGLTWSRHGKNPILRPDAGNAWEKERITARHVVKQGDWYFMFYTGFRDTDHAQIGVARSRDGVTGWQKHPANPIIRPGAGQWDADAVYKPYAIYDGKCWLLWYHGRRGGWEQIGVAIHEGEDLGF